MKEVQKKSVEKEDGKFVTKEAKKREIVKE